MNSSVARPPVFLPAAKPAAAPAWSKRLSVLGAGALARATAWRLRRRSTAVRDQATVFAQLTARLSKTSVWRAAGLEAGLDYRTFRSRLASHSYEQLAPAVERMKRGEADVLWPGRCTHRGSLAGDLSGITAMNLPGWVEKHLYEPGGDIAQMADWPAKLAAIVRRTAPLDITMLAGIPSWVLILAAELRAHAAQGGRKIENVQGLWPRFECLVHGGVPLDPFHDELRAALGPTVNFHEVYPASEGFIAAQDADAGLGLRLMANAGIFYEFIPMAEFDDSRLAQLGAKAIPLAEVTVGVDYALVMTTPAGLVRYVIGDIVRFTSTEPPRLVYIGRTKLQLSAFGEHVIEKELTDALLAACQRHGRSIANFHAAPLFANSLAGQNRGRHEWWIELKSGGAPTPAATQFATELDRELQRLNDDYEAKRQGGGLEPPLVRLVAPGTFEQWQRQHGQWGGQHKMPRCRSDRQIADALAQATGVT